MIFKPAKLLPALSLRLNTIFLYLFTTSVILSQTMPASCKAFASRNPDRKAVFQKDTLSNNDIILPYYPFKHELTHEADSLYLSRSDKEALAKYKFANSYFQKTGNWVGVGYTGNMMAEIYTNRLSNYDLAEKQLKETEQLIKEKLGDQHPLLSDTYLTYGSYHGNMGPADLEQKYLEKSLGLRINFFGLKSIQVAEADYRIGQFYHYTLKQDEQAIEYFNMALTLFKEFLLVNHPDLLKVYYSLGSCYRLKKDYHRANISLDYSIYYYSIDSLSNVKQLAQARLVKANTLNEIRLDDFALSNYALAIEAFEKASGPVSHDLIKAYLGLGVEHLRLGDYEQAIQDFDKSLSVHDVYYTHEAPYESYSSILVDKGECYTKMQKKDSSRYYLFKALNVQRTFYGDDHYLVSYIYYAIAGMHNNFRQYDSALYYSQLALIELIPDFNDPDYKQNPKISNSDENLTLLMDILAFKANIYMNQFQVDSENTELLTEALELYNSLDQLSDNLKNSDFAQESKLILTADIHKIYSLAIECIFQLYQINKDEKYLNTAIRFFEKNKYMLLFQNLELARKSNELNIPFEYRFKEDSLNLLLAEITQKVDNNNPQFVSKLSADRLAIDNALTALKNEIKLNYPSLYEIEFDDLTVNIEQLKEYAALNKSLLIEYFVSDSSLFILGVSPGNVTLHQIKRTRKLNSNLDTFLSSLANGQQSGNIQESYTNFKTSAYFIYNAILLPVLEQHHPVMGNIIISPDGILAQVPFEALIDDLPDSDYPDYTRLNYLIRSYDISYVYSFNLFFADKIQEPVKQNTILAFSYSGIDVLKNPEKRSEDVLELPGTTKEIESIKKIVRGKNLFLEDEEATETQFKTKSPDYQILHLAVHGIADNESSINSRLVFKNKKDSLNDGNLFIYEIYNIDLSKAKLAILSACESGIGKKFQGEGVFSVARGFASAGCPCIIMSLWNVNDKVSADIMAEFYKNLKKGITINESLRASKIHYLDNADELQAQPGNWAAFVPLGQMYSIYERKINPIMIGIIILIIVVIPIFILVYKRPYKPSV